MNGYQVMKVLFFYLSLLDPRKFFYLPELVWRLRDLREHEKGLALEHVSGAVHDGECTWKTHANMVDEYNDILGRFA